MPSVLSLQMLASAPHEAPCILSGVSCNSHASCFSDLSDHAGLFARE